MREERIASASAKAGWLPLGIGHTQRVRKYQNQAYRSEEEPSMDQATAAPVRRVALIGNYLPRRCGIATFTTHLCEALSAEFPHLHCFAVPVNDTPEGYDYPPRVRFEITENDLSSYRQAADFLNTNEVDLVCVQHEYGIFGGPAGSHILSLLQELRMPIVTTLHTVLKEPDAHQRRVLERLAEISDRLIVMAHLGVDFLREIYRVPADKIELIPHGIPDVPFVDPNFYKDRFGVEGRTVLLTFGLLSPNKGIEYAIQALPAILQRHPSLVYIILGATHPHVRKREGESYRLHLERLARDLDVAEHVLFHEQFVSDEELVEFIGAADIYLTPYLNPAQITSGTLAYTVGMGKAVISTPYWYAQELLADGRGVLVPFRDARAIAEAVLDLLDHEGERHAMRKRAYLYGREMIWSRVAQRYYQCFLATKESRQRHPRPVALPRTLARRPGDLPPLQLVHLRSLLDTTGLFQHARYGVPCFEHGYTTDDNARGLLLAMLLEDAETETEFARELGTRCLAFLFYAFHEPSRRYRNLLSFQRHWLDEIGSEDCHGRALWALGTAVARCRQAALQQAAGQLFEASLPTVHQLTSPRSWAATLLGIHEYLRHFPGDRAVQGLRDELAGRLAGLYQRCADSEWRWFEDILAYDNALLCAGLLAAARSAQRDDWHMTALEALRWLTQVQKSPQGHFVPIGSNGFYKRGGLRARFDQQPLEAAAQVVACLTAYESTADPYWYRQAQIAFEWFLGRNDLQTPVYDPATGGCRDGLHPDRVNQNMGAEATLTFCISLMYLKLSEAAWTSLPAAAHKVT